MKRLAFLLVFSSTVQAGQIVQWQDFPAPPEGNDFVAIAQGKNHALALRSNGQIECWAQASYEHLCDCIPDGNYVAIAAGYNRSGAVRSDGSLWSHVSGLPNGNNYMAIAVDDMHGVGLKTDGSLVSWGDNREGQVSDTPVGNGFITVVARDYYSMALRNDGRVFEWGERFYSQLYADPEDPNDPNAAFYIAIGAGHRRRYAIREDGYVVSWGNREINPQPPDGNYVAIASGELWLLTLTDEGSLVATGDSWHLPFDQEDLPDGNNFVAISAYGQYGMALASNESRILRLITEPNDIIGIDPTAGTHSYYLGKPICLNAKRSTKCPDVYHFHHWSGDIADPCEQAQFVFVDANMTVTAHYTLDERECGDECHPISEYYDVNRDCYVNMIDFAIFASEWGCTHPDCD